MSLKEGGKIAFEGGGSEHRAAFEAKISTCSFGLAVVKGTSDL